MEPKTEPTQETDCHQRSDKQALSFLSCGMWPFPGATLIHGSHCWHFWLDTSDLLSEPVLGLWLSNRKPLTPRRPVLTVDCEPSLNPSPSWPTDFQRSYDL